MHGRAGKLNPHTIFLSLHTPEQTDRTASLLRMHFKMHRGALQTSEKGSGPTKGAKLGINR